MSLATHKRITIAIDGMGGDYGLKAIIPAMHLSYEALKDDNLHFLLYGDAQSAARLLSKYEQDFIDSITLYDVSLTIDPEINPLKLLKSGKETSMGMAISAVAEGKAQGVFSSGATGAYIALCWKILGLLPTTKKVALPGLLPKDNGVTLMLDLGASPVVTEEDLVHFAIMGNALYEVLFKKKKPTIGMLNIGTEDIKGLPYLIKANAILKEHKDLDYKGFVEGNDVFNPSIDMIVCDGYAGNIALKTMKGCAVHAFKKLKAAFTASVWSKLCALGLKSNLLKLKEDLDWRKHNGAPILGLAHLAVKAHGDSDEVALSAALNKTYYFVKSDLMTAIKDKMDGLEKKQATQNV